MKNRFELLHVGINTGSPEEAERLSRLLAAMFNLECHSGPNSRFAGSYFECMKDVGRGAKGHIAMGTADLPAAVAELEEKGVTFNRDTAVYAMDGRLLNIYLAGEYGGFAIHILQK